MGSFNKYLSNKYQSGIKYEDQASYNPINSDFSWKRKGLAIISPKSGKGTAQSDYDEVASTLKANGFDMEIFVIEKKDHATEFLKEMHPEKIKNIYCIFVFGGDGVITETMNGFFKKNREVIQDNNLQLRVAAFLGGTANAGLTNACQHHDLQKSLHNALYVVTRDRFKDMSAFKLEVSSSKDNYATTENLWAWHTLMYGCSADIMKDSERYRWAGGMRYSIAVLRILFCNRKSRNIKFWWSEKKIEPLPRFDEELPIGEGDDWQYWTGSVTDCGLSFYPIVTDDFCMTKRIKMGTDFTVSSMCPAETGLSGYKQWLDDGGDMEKGLDESKVGKSRTMKSFRMFLDDNVWNEEQSPMSLDGSLFFGSKFQGNFDENVVRQIC